MMSRLVNLCSTAHPWCAASSAGAPARDKALPAGVPRRRGRPHGPTGRQQALELGVADDAGGHGGHEAGRQPRRPEAQVQQPGAPLKLLASAHAT